MATLKDLFPSRYITKEDIGPGKLLTITGVKQENVGKEDEPDIKPVLLFSEIHKPFVLNMTNATTISSVYGEDFETWPGKQIVLFFDPAVMFKGKTTGGIRVRAPKGVVAATDPDLPF